MTQQKEIKEQQCSIILKVPFFAKWPDGMIIEAVHITLPKLIAQFEGVKNEADAAAKEEVSKCCLMLRSVETNSGEVQDVEPGENCMYFNFTFKEFNDLKNFMEYVERISLRDVPWTEPY